MRVKITFSFRHVQLTTEISAEDNCAIKMQRIVHFLIKARNLAPTWYLELIKPNMFSPRSISDFVLDSVGGHF